ncbi:MAG: S9 family peptidase [Novosphingobium sp.]|nr:S9 family peptidase [Novosphingobium sp.]
MIRFVLVSSIAVLAITCGDAAAAQTTPPSATPAVAAPAALEAPPPRISAAAFAKTGGISKPILSPDGKRIALTVQLGGKSAVAVLDSETRAPIRRLDMPDKQELEWYKWAGSDRLLISASTIVPWFGDEARATRLVLSDLSTGKSSYIVKGEMGLEGDDLLYTDPDGQFVLLAMQRTIYDYPSVWRFPLDGTAAKTGKEIQRPQNGIWEWFADDAGVVRMGLEFGNARTKVWYRKTDADPFRAIAKLTEDNVDDQIWDVIRITNGSDEGYALKPDESGRMALRRFNYATRTPGETVFAAPGWDVTDYTLDKDNKPLAAYYTDDRDRVHWFDPKMQALQAKLARAMPNSDLSIVSQARDDSRMIVWSAHEDDPGAYYLYTAATRRLDAFAGSRPEIDPAVLARPKPISFTARDKTVVHGYLTLPRGRPPRNLPLIVLPHGGPYGVRDWLRYDGDVQFLANRGYAVIQPNYRGSDGYGSAFEELGDGQIGRAMQDDLDDAVDWAVAQGLADPKRVCVVGASYGGYAALWAVTRNPERYRCAVSFAGVTDWKRQLKYDDRFFSSKGRRKWRSRVAGEAAAFDLDLVSPVVQIEKLTRPVLLTHGEDDTNVPFKQYTLYRDAAAKAGKPVETLVFAKEGHGFSKPESEQKWYEALEAFLVRHNPAD